MNIEQLIPDPELRQAVAREVFACLPDLEEADEEAIANFDWETQDISHGWNSCREMMCRRLIDKFFTEEEDLTPFFKSVPRYEDTM